jgi:hypothetical protein
MTAAFLLFAAMLAADNPAPVQAKILYGSGLSIDQRADIELWISQAVAKSGSPLALSHTGWIVLTSDEQRLYASKQGGFIIDGKVTEKDGKYEVEINGCEGVGFQQMATLTPGERRVVKLTDNPAPHNVFVALEAPVSKQAQKHVDAVPIDAKVGREGSNVRFLPDGDQTIIEITSEFGIDKATIRRKLDAWPKPIFVRLHLSGLESFKAGGDDVAVEWSASSTGDNSSRVSLQRGKEELALDEKSPYHTNVRIVGGNGKIPLKDGYFELPLPAMLFEGNPKELTFQWIDFYRN